MARIGTLGIEEEFYIVDAATRAPVPAAETVLSAVDQLDISVTGELTPMQIELKTPVCGNLTTAALALIRGRRILAKIAAQHGWKILASATPPLGDVPPPPLRDIPRYSALFDRFGALLEEQGTCGLHVHVGVSNIEDAVRVCGYLRPWLSYLLAISANSPFHLGRDTCYASWRAIIAGRWPTITAPPVMSDHAEFSTTVRQFQRHGVALDASGVYWWARPSVAFSTVEVRIADSQPTVADTMLIAALARALVLEALHDIRTGAMPPHLDDAKVNGMIWRAAREGLEGMIIDAGTDEVAPAFTLIRRLCSRLRPHLEKAGDWRTVECLLDRLHRLGSSAQRQRVAAQRGGLRSTVDSLSLQLGIR
ncbi:glutamate--cysteine ligase [Nonomuraea sp. SMC257]|uniref:Putative glutamate--cysteine ligase 2 n=1 Tax=Nonomuraea montanisoli TaxID=2741721 RepID=A0A7Y6IFB2_9ACTN|nr:glutamate--cysteine ligase [Nonomuraea montanisoli]NUW37168.1 glutamate--cysteine ligase [Nonomuraea montanisoli]